MANSEDERFIHAVKDSVIKNENPDPLWIIVHKEVEKITLAN